MAHLIDADPTAEARRIELSKELAPAGVLQTMLVEQIARAMGRLARIDAVEPVDGPADPAWLRAQAQAERSFYRALTEFRRTVKAARAAAQGDTPLAPDRGGADLAPLARYPGRGAGGEGLDSILSQLKPADPQPNPLPESRASGSEGLRTSSRPRIPGSKGMPRMLQSAR